MFFRGHTKFNILEAREYRGILGQALGKIYYVDGNSGSDGNSGESKVAPMKTITAALAKCVNDRDDYILVKDGWDQDAGTITVNKSRVHIIGIGNRLSPYVMQAATGDTYIFTVTSTYCEIAGFALGGGVNKGGIECVGSIGLWVHDCFFGDADIGDTPKYGILSREGSVSAYMLIEDCIFAGSGGTSQGKISATGIYARGTNIMRGTVIRNNIFGQLPSGAIELLNMVGGFIIGNVIACDEDGAGAGIIMSGSTGCMIINNVANYGKADMSTNPFVDTGVVNCWAGNIKGDDFQHPA